MKKVLIILFLVISGISCDDVDKLTMFEIDYESSVIVPSSTGINVPLDLFTPEVTTDSEATFESNNTRKDLIEEIRLTKMELEIVVPTGEDFSFLKNISIAIEAEGLSEKRIAWDDDVSSSSGSTLELNVSPDDLKEYIKKDKFNLKVTTTTDEFITEDYEIRVLTTFFVDAKILGV